MTLPASALPVEAPLAFLGVSHSATGKLWRDRLDARGAARALAISQRYQLPEMLARVLAGLFILAMFALIGALLVFLREIFLAVNAARGAMR